MCGIAGRYNFDEKVVSWNAASRMIDIIRHRGPEQQNHIFIETESSSTRRASGSEIPGIEYGNLYLGHARLSIIDLAGGSQPMFDSSGTVAVVFNGEIYNYKELRQELITRGHRFHTSSDTEVILEAYKAFGESCVNKFLGMFAFALYDFRRKVLFCSRDRLGIKPFYYYFDNCKFLFASEVKSLLTQPDVSRDIDYTSIADYLTFQNVNDNKTFFAKIKQLPAGYTVTLNGPRLLFRRYWNPDLEPDNSLTENDAIERLKYLIDDSIKIHTRSDVPIGAHLSGGIDSSAICCKISKLLGIEIMTFTGRFADGGIYDESHYAREVAEQINSRSFIITPSAEDLVDNLSKIIWHMDYPAVGPGVFPQFMVSQKAGAKLKVVLGGQGGDEIFLGYPRYLRNLIENKLLFGVGDRCLDKLNSINLLSHYLYTYGHNGVAGWAAKRRWSDFEGRYIKTSALLYGMRKFFTGQLAEASRDYDPIALEAAKMKSIPSDSLINKMSWYDIGNYLNGLLHVEDRTSMAWSLESRVPLLDHRIVEFALKIPSDIKLKGLTPKYIFLKAVEDDLPPAIRNRTDKRGFPTPTNHWFDNDLSWYAKKFVNRDILLKRGLLADKKLLDFLDSGNRRLMPWLTRGSLLWPLINIELWFQLFVDNDYTGSPTIYNRAAEFLSAQETVLK